MGNKKNKNRDKEKNKLSNKSKLGFKPKSKAAAAVVNAGGENLGFKPENEKHAADATTSDGTGIKPDPKDLHSLLEAHTKDQLIDLLQDAISSDPSLLGPVLAAADRSSSHKKLFVHGLSWDTSGDALLHAFLPFGPIRDYTVILDKSTGRCKGFGFVLFRKRSSAIKALKNPSKKVGSRMTSCWLASVGSIPSGSSPSLAADAASRRVYVGNVHADTAPKKLLDLFSRYGEIESGPYGFDVVTGKSKGYAIFVYKTLEGSKSALEEPYKMFEGHQLHCQVAADPAHKGKQPAAAAAAAPTMSAAAPTMSPAAMLLGSAPQSVLAAVAAAQNLALNPAYGGLLGQNPLLNAAALNPNAAAVWNPTAAAMLNPTAVAMLNPRTAAVMNQGIGVAGLDGGTSLLLGAYGSQAMAGGLQGLPSHQVWQLGQSSSTMHGGVLGAFPSTL